MAAVHLKDWVKDVFIRLPGATEAVIEHELFAAAQEFFRDSLSWVAVLSHTVQEGQRYVYISPTVEGCNVGAVLSVLYDNSALTPRTSPPTPRREAAPGSPTEFFMVDNGTLQLVPTPKSGDTGKEVRVFAALIPSSIDVAVPADTMVRDRDALINGTLARLFAYPDRPWSNAQLARHHEILFRADIGRARKASMARYVQGLYTWFYPPWA